MTQQLSDNNAEREATITIVLGVKLASAVLLVVYFGLSRLLHEYVCTMLIAVVLSLLIIIKVSEKARRIRNCQTNKRKDF